MYKIVILMVYTQVIRDKSDFLFEAAQTRRISKSTVESFLSATATLLLQMLMSESPIIPWTGQEIYDPLFVDVDARQLSNHPNAMTEEYFKGWRIAGYKRPILLSCNYRKVKVVKGKVWLEMLK